MADQLGARSVAFPAISTGAYGLPPRIAAQVAVTTLRSTSTKSSGAHAQARVSDDGHQMVELPLGEEMRVRTVEGRNDTTRRRL